MGNEWPGAANWGDYHEVPQQGNDWDKLLAGFTQGSRRLERIFRQLEADPAQAEAWLKQQSGLSLIPIHLESVARLLDEVQRHTVLRVAARCIDRIRSDPRSYRLMFDVSARQPAPGRRR